MGWVFRFIYVWGLGWLPLVSLTSCGPTESDPTRFRRLTADQSGIDFINQVQEDSLVNALDFTNIYTGSGVGIGDLDNDGLPEIVLGGCMRSMALYHNLGSLQFEDIAPAAGIETDRWITGVSLVDLNADSLLDIYLCVSGPPHLPRQNLLYINQGNLRFTEAAQGYGLADSSQCTQASFLDYDQDGDLDVFLAVNPTDYTIFNVNNIRKKKLNGEANSTDKLYRNDGDGTFSDVSREAGILIEGYSLGLHAGDFNDDGWTDVYVTNDFLSNDILYLNQGDGTFKDALASSLKHTSYASMGIDVSDLNNDGLREIFVADMYPEDREHEKMMIPGGDHNRFRYILKAGYAPQYSRNTLQYNHGNGTYSEIGQLAGVHKTDWSWSPLIVDLDNDGLRDLFISNGFLRDVGDLDYINYVGNHSFGSPKAIRDRQLEEIKKLKGIKLPNYVYHNQGDFDFVNQAIAWGLPDSTFTQGAAYGDLDRDGDWDLVLNNMNQSAMVYENRSQELDPKSYLSLLVTGPAPNLEARGTKIWLYYHETIQYMEVQPNRGYASSVDPLIKFGVGEEKEIDSLVILWPNHEKSTFTSLQTDSLYRIVYPTYKRGGSAKKAPDPTGLSPSFSALSPLAYKHQEDHYFDFDQQPLLPHQFTQQGPAIAVGDVNGDGLEDVYIGGAATFAGTIGLQQEDGSFILTSLTQEADREDVDAYLFDSDGDQDLDLYVVSGGSLYSQDPTIYQDRLYLNDGKGNFELASEAIPPMPTSGAFVSAQDIDQDGDQDLFVGGRVVPGQYPQAPRSYVLRNDQGTFVDVSHSWGQEVANLGMLTDACWADINQDGIDELIVVGEWLPVSVFEWKNQQFVPLQMDGLDKSDGWWNCVATGDFDQDGDIDLIAGNLGYNSDYRPNRQEPMCLYAKDYNGDGRIDPIMCQFYEGKEYPIAARDHFLNQLKQKTTRFKDYRSYARATFSEVFEPAELADAKIWRAYELASCYFENKGNNTFERRPLPWELQVAPITDIWVEDMDADGWLDAVAVGNSFATEVKTGRYDAFTGAYLHGQPKGFEIQMGPQSGFYADRDARKIQKLNWKNQLDVYLIANNADSLGAFVLASTRKN